MYVQPTQNVWWKYRQKATQRKHALGHGHTVRIGIPQSDRTFNHSFYPKQPVEKGLNNKLECQQHIVSNVATYYMLAWGCK